MTAAHLTVVEGEVLDRPRFTHLYRLLDVERSAVEEWQRLSMPAALEVLTAYESGQEWRDDKQAEWDAYVAQHGYVPQWSPTSERSFVKWLEARARRDGHEPKSLRTVKRLMYAAQCVRLVQSNKVIPAGITLTEDSWRPVYKLLTHGFKKQIATVVKQAAELAEGEGKQITSGHMSTAAAQVWKTDPEIRTWVEQPGQTVDPRSKHDRAVTAYNNAKAAADELRKLDDGQMWRRFADYIREVDA